MKKGSIIAVIVVVIVVLAGGYAIFHKSNSSSKSDNTSASSNAPAVNNAVLITKTDSSQGQYLADPSGRPLYTYNKDTAGVSNCSGSCIANWPAYVAKGSTADLPAGVTLIKRSDGQMQYAYNGQALYYFTPDSPGHPTGNGVEDFKLARPAAASSSQPSSSSSSSSSNSSSQPSNSSSSSNPYSY